MRTVLIKVITLKCVRFVIKISFSDPTWNLEICHFGNFELTWTGFLIIGRNFSDFCLIKN
nr:MAG TPA: hypothetical protein [Caudoviricetes sp.]